MDKKIIIDFDSTFVKVESLDILGEISLEGQIDKQARLAKIAETTNKGMNGEMSFAESLSTRLSLLNANKNHLPALIERLKSEISVSFERNKTFIQANAANIYIVSSGFKEFIIPVVADFGINESNVYANTFGYDAEGQIIGCDKNNPLAQDKGKVKLMESLNLGKNTVVIGDGFTDYEIKEAGLASKFYAFTENVSRDKVVAVADHVTPSFDEFLYDNEMPGAISYPKNRINILLLENVHPNAKRILEAEGFNVETIKGALDEDELIKKIEDVHVLGIRSKTMVTKKVLEHANKLMVVGAFCIGTNQIDLDACTEKGVVVFNAPYSNTRSVVELAIGEIIMLMRRIPEKDKGMHEGDWDKSADNCFEVRHKSLGIIGYGNIGSQLSILAEALGMRVYFYDVVERLALGNARKCETLEELLSTVDVVSLHVDGRPDNKNFFKEKHFAMMKQGSYFLNLARGPVMEVEGLKKHMDSGKIIGAGVDVFPYEPKTNGEKFESPLRGIKNLILSPHIGGSTLEAQEHIGTFVPNKIASFINSGDTYGSVNFPNLQLPSLQKAHRIIHIHENIPGILAKINNIMAEFGCNILGQYLKTNENVGYVILDIERKYPKDLVEQMKNIKGTIKFRRLY
jgi:D-3-phosphoglycerate dehydrogenase / 2-oxoglutarate reductase